MNKESSTRLAPAQFLYYWQLKMKNWITKQWRSMTTSLLAPPKLIDGLEIFKDGRNLMWLQQVSDIPALAMLAAPVNLPSACNNHNRGDRKPPDTPCDAGWE